MDSGRGKVEEYLSCPLGEMVACPTHPPVEICCILKEIPLDILVLT